MCQLLVSLPTQHIQKVLVLRKLFHHQLRNKGVHFHIPWCGDFAVGVIYSWWWVGSLFCGLDIFSSVFLYSCRAFIIPLCTLFCDPFYLFITVSAQMLWVFSCIFSASSNSLHHLKQTLCSLWHLTLSTKTYWCYLTRWTIFIAIK